MSVSKLLASNLGAIILHNAHALIHSDLLDDKDKRLVLIGLRRAARRLQMPYRPQDLVDILREELKPMMAKLQVASLSYPVPDLRLTAVRGWADVRDMLEGVYKKTKPDRTLEGIIYSSVHSDAFYEKAARALNARLNRDVPVVLSGAWNIFYMTSTERLDRVAPGYQRLPYSQRATKVRDVLGLGHLAPDSKGNPYALFAFHSTVPASRLERSARIARPTTVDGFDNDRFKQAWPPVDLDPGGGGLTVRLDVPFGAGSSEFVSTMIPLWGHFTCEYLGCVGAPAAGSDEAFVDYLNRCHGGILANIPTILESWRPA